MVMHNAVTMPPRSTYPLLDRLLDGHLAERLTERRAAGESFDTIAEALRREHGVSVSGATVRRWIMDLEGTE